MKKHAHMPCLSKPLCTVVCKFPGGQHSFAWLSFHRDLPTLILSVLSHTLVGVNLHNFATSGTWCIGAPQASHSHAQHSPCWLQYGVESALLSGKSTLALRVRFKYWVLVLQTETTRMVLEDNVARDRHARAVRTKRRRSSWCQFIIQYQCQMRLPMRAPLQQGQRSTCTCKKPLLERRGRRTTRKLRAQFNKQDVRSPWFKLAKKCKNIIKKKKKTQERQRDVLKSISSWQYQQRVCTSEVGSKAWKCKRRKWTLATTWLPSAHKHAAGCPKIKTDTRLLIIYGVLRPMAWCSNNKDSRVLDHSWSTPNLQTHTPAHMHRLLLARVRRLVHPLQGAHRTNHTMPHCTNHSFRSKHLQFLSLLHISVMVPHSHQNIFSSSLLSATLPRSCHSKWTASVLSPAQREHQKNTWNQSTRILRTFVHFNIKGSTPLAWIVTFSEASNLHLQSRSTYLSNCTDLWFLHQSYFYDTFPFSQYLRLFN